MHGAQTRHPRMQTVQGSHRRSALVTARRAAHIGLVKTTKRKRMMTMITASYWDKFLFGDRERQRRREEAYLSQSTSLYDLEQRQREIDRGRFR